MAVSTSGTGHSIVEETLASNRIRRQIGLRVPSFLGLGPILANTDLIAILPEQLGVYLAQSGKVRLVGLPVDIPPYFIYQMWHERLMHDPASQWFRKVVAGLFLRTPGSQPGATEIIPDQHGSPAGTQNPGFVSYGRLSR